MRTKAIAAVGLLALAAVGVTVGVRIVGALPRSTDLTSPAILRSTRLGPLPANRVLSMRVVPRSDAQARAVADELLGGGVAVEHVDNDSVTARASVRVFDSVFGVDLSEWHDPKSGEVFYGPGGAIKFPIPLKAVLGLDNFARAFPLGQSILSDESGNPISPQQLEKAYDLPSGTDGSGQTVAIYGQRSLDAGYQSLWNDYYKLPDLNYMRLEYRAYDDQGQEVYDPNMPHSSEVTLDVIAVHSIAPKAKIHVYEFKDPADGYSQTLQFVSFLRVVAANGEHIATLSYGSCEAAWVDEGLGELPYLSGAFGEAARAGISIFAGSGDDGRTCAYGSAGGNAAYPVGVTYPASDPSVTAVGGTHLELGSGDTISGETAWDWNDTEASGGGSSNAFPAEVYQSYLPTHGYRLVPDVAADASLATGIGGAGGPGKIPGKLSAGFLSTPGSGTSQAAPIWAGIAADYDQRAVASHVRLLGFANVTLYSLANQANHPIRDITTNEDKGFWHTLPGLCGDGCDLPDRGAAKGWDPATGLGGPDIAVLIDDGIAAASPHSLQDIRAVDWTQLALPAGTCGSEGPLTLHGGLAKVAPPNGYLGFATVEAIAYSVLPGGPGPAYGDLAGDGRTEAALDISCDTGAHTGASGLGDVLLVYVIDPEDQLLLLGTLRPTHLNYRSASSGHFDHIGIKVGIVTADEHYYQAGDPSASPSGLDHHVWPWTANGGFGSS